VPETTEQWTWKRFADLLREKKIKKNAHPEREQEPERSKKF
jgi:hypothetical protein